MMLVPADAPVNAVISDLFAQPQTGDTVENTPAPVQVAQSLGIVGILHADYRSTRDDLASFGLPVDKGGIHVAG